MAQNASSIKTSSMKTTSETYSTLRKGTEHFISQQWELFVKTSYLYRDQELRENDFLQRQSGFHSWGEGVADILSSKAVV